MNSQNWEYSQELVPSIVTINEKKNYLVCKYMEEDEQNQKLNNT